MFEIFQEIDQVQLNFSASGKQVLNATIAFIMFGVALELRVQDFKDLLNRPKPALVGILSQFFLMPLLTFLFVISIHRLISPTIGMGMILVAACPGGNVSNFISSLAKGNIALSVSLTAVSSLGGIVMTPLNFAFWGGMYMKFIAAKHTDLVQNLSIDIWEVLQTIALILALPLLLGMMLRYFKPFFTQRILITVKRLSLFIFIGIIVAIFSSNFDLFLKYIAYIFGIVLTHNALAFLLGYNTARLFGLAIQDRKTISIETGIQNSGLALALLFNPAVFPPDLAIGGMAFIAAWWGVWHIISGVSLAGYWTRFKLR
jgi:BASS family bile acid:Na+ symporter